MASVGPWRNEIEHTFQHQITTVYSLQQKRGNRLLDFQNLMSIRLFVCFLKTEKWHSHRILHTPNTEARLPSHHNQARSPNHHNPARSPNHQNL